jgi:hypothetical protein
VIQLLPLAFALSLIAPTAPAGAVTTYQVKDPNAQARGRVLDKSSNTPISGARVVFAFRGRSRLQTVTDENGRFSFTDLEPGPYQITVLKAGYVPLAADALPTYWLVAGQTLDVATVSLQKTGAIAGRILDPSGEPLVDVNVKAMKPGGTAVASAAISRTNDLGEFRVFGLPPGEYIIVASPQPFGLDSLLASTALVLSTYYPGTADAATAQALMVGAGETVGGIEFRILTAPTFKVSGVVVDDRGRPIAGATIRLAGDSRASGGIAAGIIGDGRSDAAGKFSIGNVRSGAYYATATAPSSDPVHVVVSDADVEGVTIVARGR